MMLNRNPDHATAPSVPRSALTFLLALLVPMAQTMASGAPAAPELTPAALQARLAKMDTSSTVECHTDKYGNPACTAGGYDVDVTGCDDRGDSFFGQVLRKPGATLGNAIAPDKAKPVAQLADGQFLCIAATAEKEGATTRLYVEALPIERVAACKGNHLCASHAVQWIAPKPADECKWIGHDGDFSGGCAAGWVDEDKVEQFSMGMH